jgi:uncharacterized membrane protein
MSYVNVALRSLAVLVGLVLVVLAVAKIFRFEIATRVSQNVFSEYVAGLTVVSRLLILSIVVEFIILASLLVLHRASWKP